MDAIARLIAAIAEARARMGGGGRRAPGKNKKVKAVARVAGKGGPSVGCGTGKGGFKAGNQCAKEDGIPQRPLGQGGGLKKADAKADLALAKKLREKAAARKARKEALDRKKSEAAKPQREAKAKAKKIEYLRRKAAERKAQKDQRDAAEKKAAKQAADKKRAALLQKIRIKKATARLTVAGTPKSIKQEIEELKLRKASESLKVASAPSIRKELDALKSKLAAQKKAIAAVKKAESEPEKPAVSVGKTLMLKQNSTTIAQEDALSKDRSLVFGEHLKAGWYYGSGAVSDGTKIRSEQKRFISHQAAMRLDKMGIKESDVDDEIFSLFRAGDFLGPTNAEQLIKAGIPESLHRRYAISAAMVTGWAATSSKGAPAIGVQYAASDVFKIKRAHTRKLTDQLKKFPAWKETVEKIRKHKVVHAVLKSHHEATQADLKSKGITELTLVRGYESSARVNQGGDQDVPLQPASSFSMSKAVAERFAGTGKKARHLTTTIPANKVLSMCTTGFGCMHEQEIVILGGVVRGRLVDNRAKW
jgi:hypothetical protein